MRKTYLLIFCLCLNFFSHANSIINIDNLDMSDWTNTNTVPDRYGFRASYGGYFSKSSETYNGNNALQMTYGSSEGNAAYATTPYVKLRAGEYELTFYVKGNGYFRSINFCAKGCEEDEKRRGIPTDPLTVSMRPMGTTVAAQMLDVWTKYTVSYTIKEDSSYTISFAHNNRIGGTNNSVDGTKPPFLLSGISLVKKPGFDDMVWREREDLNQTMPTGIKFYECNSPLPDNTPFYGVYAEIDLKANSNLEFKAIYNGDGGVYNYPTTKASTENSYVLVNGGFFEAPSGTASRVSRSIVVNKGNILAPILLSHRQKAALWTLSKTGENGIHVGGGTGTQIWSYPTYTATTYTVITPWIAMGGGPRILMNGQVNTNREGFNDDHVNGRHPRTIVGYKDNGNVILMVVDGRDATRSAGIGLFQEAAPILKQLGVNNAVNLDGGGSTAMVAGNTLLNEPSDNNPSYQNQRAVPSFLLVKQKENSSLPELSKENNISWQVTDKKVQIKSNNGDNIEKILIFNITGKKLVEQQVNNVDVTIPISSGVYVVNIQTSYNNETLKIIVP